MPKIVGRKALERDEKLLNLSRVTTPDALSMEDLDLGSEGNDDVNSNDPISAKKHSEYIVRLKNPPKF